MRLPKPLAGFAAVFVSSLVLGVALAGAAAPVVSVENASQVSYTTAKVKGTVDPEDHETSYHFDYATQAQFEASEWGEASSAGFGSLPEGAGTTEVSETLTGLVPHTTYHLRLVAENTEAERVEALAASTFETEEVTPPSVSGLQVSSVTATGAHFAGSVDTNAPTPLPSAPEDHTFDAHWSFSCNPGCPGPSGTAPAAEAPEEIGGDVGGLQPNSAYEVTLSASNPGGEAIPETVSFETEAAPPTVTQTGNTPLGQTEFGLGGFLTPANSAVTDCHFDWGPTSAYGQSVPCLDEAGEPLGPIADNNAHLVKAKLSGLTPGATYHYRLSATTVDGGTVTSADGHFQALAPLEAGCANATALGGTQLPNCRAWELVTPPDKNGADAIPDTTRTRAAADGGALDFETLGAFGDTEGTDVSTEYIAERSAQSEPGNSGWSSHSVTFNQKPNSGEGISLQFHSGYLGELSPDLNRGVSLSFTPLTEDPFVADVSNLYLRSDLRQAGPGAGYQLLTPCPGCSGPLAPPPANILGKRLQPHLAWNSPDFSHVLFESKQALTADTPESPGCELNFENPFVSRLCRTHLFEWANGTLRLAGRVPVLPAQSCDDEAGPACVGADLSLAGAGTGNFNGATPTLVPQTVSDGSDGHSRIFFTQPTNASGQTSEEITPVIPQRANFNEQTKEGRLFMRLDGTSTVEIDASERTDCAGDPSCGGDGIPDPAPTEFARSKFQDASRDGTRAFFTSAASLTDDAPASGGLYMYDATKPASDPHNLTLVAAGESIGTIGASTDGHYLYFLGGSQIYLWHDDEIKFVGSTNLSAEQNTLGSGRPQARVSPDGRHLLFITGKGEENLSRYGGTDYDQTGTLECGNEAGRCKEFYLYNADTETLVCASCDPSGGAPGGDALGLVTEHVAASEPFWARNHTLSSNGRYVFFSSPDRLVAADHNSPCPLPATQTPKLCYDAFEYDSLTGQIHLLSTGEGSKDAYFLDASADGRNAFIDTREALSGWDVDSSYDIYDARVGGGFPEPAPPPPACQGDACQPPPNSPRDPSIASGAFSGAGNQAKKAKKRHKKRHQARKHHHHRQTSTKRRAGR